MRNTNAKCCWPPIIELEMILVLHPISIDKKTSSKMAGGERLPCPVALRLKPPIIFREFQRNQRFGECEKILTATTGQFIAIFTHTHTHPTFIQLKKKSSSLNYRHSTADNKNSIAVFHFSLFYYYFIIENVIVIPFIFPQQIIIIKFYVNFLCFSQYNIICLFY
jgi:hypothetical protein